MPPGRWHQEVKRQWSRSGRHMCCAHGPSDCTMTSLMVEDRTTSQRPPVSTCNMSDSRPQQKWQITRSQTKALDPKKERLISVRKLRVSARNVRSSTQNQPCAQMTALGANNSNGTQAPAGAAAYAPPQDAHTGALHPQMHHLGVRAARGLGCGLSTPGKACVNRTPNLSSRGLHGPDLKFRLKRLRKSPGPTIHNKCTRHYRSPPVRTLWTTLSLERCPRHRISQYLINCAARLEPPGPRSPPPSHWAPAHHRRCRQPQCAAEQTSPIRNRNKREPVLFHKRWDHKVRSPKNMRQQHLCRRSFGRHGVCAFHRKAPSCPPVPAKEMPPFGRFCSRTAARASDCTSPSK